MCRLAKADRRVQFPYLTPCSIRITANISAFQAEDVGSIPTWDSIIFLPGVNRSTSHFDCEDHRATRWEEAKTKSVGVAVYLATLSMWRTRVQIPYGLPIAVLV